MTTPTPSDSDTTTTARQPSIIERALRQLVDSLYPPDGERTKVNPDQALIWGGIIIGFLTICELATRLGYPPPGYWH